MPFNAIRSKLTYHPYFALVLNLDAEWSRRRESSPDGPFRRVEHRIEELCEQYVTAINANNQKMKASAGPATAEPIPSHLFSPHFYVPWGKSDCQAIVLLDDFEALPHIISGLHTSTEEVCIGYCPKLESFGVRPNAHGKQSLLVDIGSCFTAENHQKGDTHTHLEPTNSFQAQLPLLSFTRFKFEAFASIGFALLFQQALYALLPKVFASVHESLYLNRSREDIDFILDSVEDLNNIRICIIDLQGPEEMGCLIFCRNYSVAMTFISSLRSLTFSDLFEADAPGAELKAAILESNVLRGLLRIQPQLRPDKQYNSKLDIFHNNHVFRWTNTTLSVAPNSFFDPGNTHRQNCHGKVKASAEFKIPPGHHHRFRKAYAPLTETTSSKDPLPSDVTLYETGRGDTMIQIGNSSKEITIPLTQAIAHTLEIHRIFGTVNSLNTARDVVDCNTILDIPVPDSLTPNTPFSPVRVVELGHTPLFGSALIELQKRICYPETVPPNERPRHAPFAGRLSIERLRTIPRTYGIPASLRRNIESLFQNFAILVADYYSFDTVIDLYDAFATLHATLTDQLDTIRAKETQHAHRIAIPPLDDSRVQSLSEFVDALQNALSHRLANSYSEPVGRDMAIDLRGGLNQLLAAADATLKCGLGLLRKYARTPQGTKPRRERVGGLTRITVRPGMRAFSLNLGTEKESQLCFVEADVPHVLHVASFCDYLHESAHLIYRELERQYPDCPLSTVKKKSDNIDVIREQGLKYERLDEIFAHLMVYLFLFTNNTSNSRRKGFVLDQLISNEKQRNGKDDSDTEAIAQITELLVRLCIAEQMIPTSTDRGKWSTQKFVNRLKDRLSRQNAILRFLDDAKPAIPHWNRLWSTPYSDGWSHCVYEFEHIYLSLLPYLPHLWKWAMEVFGKFFNDACRSVYLNTDDLARELLPIVGDSIDNGRPLSRCSLSVRNSVGIDTVNEDTQGRREADKDERGVDALLLTCIMLSNYVTRREMDGNAELYLHRNIKTGQVEFPADITNWNAFLIDRGAASLFCCSPKERGHRTQQHIAIIKSLWDIGSHLRGRRMCEIIDDNWGEQE